MFYIYITFTSCYETGFDFKLTFVWYGTDSGVFAFGFLGESCLRTVSQGINCQTDDLYINLCNYAKSFGN